MTNKPAWESNKKMIIEDILKQDTYMPNSHMLKELTKSLTRLSAGTLYNLRLVISLKGENE